MQLKTWTLQSIKRQTHEFQWILLSYIHHIIIGHLVIFLSLSPLPSFLGHCSYFLVTNDFLEAFVPFNNKNYFKKGLLWWARTLFFNK